MNTFQRWAVGLSAGAVGVLLLATCVIVIKVAAGRELASHAVDRETKPLIVQGTGMVRAKPDVLVGSVRVIGKGATATEAQQQVHDRMKRILTKLTKLGVQEKDLQTSEYSLEPVYTKVPTPTRFYEYVRPGVRQWVSYPAGKMVKSYRSISVLSFKFRKVDRAGNLIDGAIEAGAESVDNVEFTVEDIKPLRQRARRLAAHYARERARNIAEGAGTRLGRVLQLSENPIEYGSASSNGLSPAYRQAQVNAQHQVWGSPPPPESETGEDEDAMEPGIMEITATVYAAFELR